MSAIDHPSDRAFLFAAALLEKVRARRAALLRAATF